VKGGAAVVVAQEGRVVTLWVWVCVCVQLV
jgi:hypothetical protein